MERAGKRHAVITGVVEGGDPAAQAEIEDWCKAAQVRRRFRDTNLAQIGRPYPGMMDLYIDETNLYHRMWLYTNLDTENYSVWDSSAGGHLAGSFGTSSMGYAHYGLPKPGAVVLVYPVITMGRFTHEGTRNNLIGSDASEKGKRQTSIECQVTTDYPPTFLWCGSADGTVMPENSRLMAKILEDKGIRCRFEEYPGVEHGVGLGIGLGCEGWFNHAVNFWLDVGNGK